MRHLYRTYRRWATDDAVVVYRRSLGFHQLALHTVFSQVVGATWIAALQPNVHKGELG
jgi:hypothetical protein